jgi:hypothetical protein
LASSYLYTHNTAILILELLLTNQL